MNFALIFQLRKIIVEKKRRERIDAALKQLKDMLFGGSDLQVGPASYLFQPRLCYVRKS